MVCAASTPVVVYNATAPTWIETHAQVCSVHHLGPCREYNTGTCSELHYSSSWCKRSCCDHSTRTREELTSRGLLGAHGVVAYIALAPAEIVSLAPVVEYLEPALTEIASHAPVVEYTAPALAATVRRGEVRRSNLCNSRSEQRHGFCCGTHSSNACGVVRRSCAGGNDVGCSRCGVISRGVAASHQQAAVAATETLFRRSPWGNPATCDRGTSCGLTC